MLNLKSLNVANLMSSQQGDDKKASHTVGKGLLAGTLAFGMLGLSACGGGDEHHEPYAVDRVAEAQEMALANAPEPEQFDFEVTDTTVVETTEADVTVAEAVGETAVDDTINADALASGETTPDETTPATDTPATDAQAEGQTDNPDAGM